MGADTELTVVQVYPELLGTYGDRGNALALVHRARGRGLRIRVVTVAPDARLPRQGDIYLLGGGEDAAMLLAFGHLRADGGLVAAVSGGAVCLGVCAGYQLLSQRFTGPDGVRHVGLGLLDVSCGRLTGARAVGEVLAESAGSTGSGFLTGFENHQGDATLGPGARPLGMLVRGVGNGDGRTEGAVQGSVVATYLHGPVLVRNDELADHLLQLVTGPLPPFVDRPVQRLRGERRRAALGSGRPWWRRQSGRRQVRSR
jgi:CobQ-like glutamine amidotransferase family enzyme